MPSYIQDPAFTQPRELNKSASPRQVADFEYDERRFEREAENATNPEPKEKKPVFSKGSLTFNSSPSSEVPAVFEQALNESILDPDQSKPEIPDVFQREMATFNLDPTPKLNILSEASQIAEAAWSNAGELSQDTLAAGADLLKGVFGVGESSVIRQAEGVAQKAWENHLEAQPQATQDTPEVGGLNKPRAQIQQFSTIPLEVHQQLADEALMKNMDRIVGREVTDIEAKEKGHLRKEAVATLVAIAKEDTAVVKKIEEREENVVNDELQDRIYGADMKRTFEDQNMAGPG